MARHKLLENELVHSVLVFLGEVVFHGFILFLWPLVAIFCMVFSVYRRLLDKLLRSKIKEKYGGLVDVADAVYLIKDTTKFTITSVLLVKSDKQRDILQIVRKRLEDKVFTEPHRYPKLTSGQYEYGGYAYWIKNDYCLNDCVREYNEYLGEVFTEEHLKKIVGEISGARFPKNDKGLWEIVVINRPLEEFKQDSYYYYPVITRFSHAIADGTSLMALLIDIVGDGNAENYSDKLFRKLFASPSRQLRLLDLLRNYLQRVKQFFYIVFVATGKAFKLSQLRKIDENALHGPSHCGQKIAAWRIENTVELMSIIKSIKNGIPGMKFSYVLMAAISASLTNFFRRNSQPIPNSTTSLITILLHFPELDSSKPARLDNKTSIAIIDLPTHESSSLSETLREVKLKAEETEHGDVMVNYWILAKIAGLFPLRLASKIVSRGTYTNFITNVPGGSRIKVLDGCVLDSVIPFAPNIHKVGISFSILSYDDRIQLGILVDKTILPSQQEVQQIANDIFDAIRLLDKDLQETTENGSNKEARVYK